MGINWKQRIGFHIAYILLFLGLVAAFDVNSEGLLITKSFVNTVNGLPGNHRRYIKSCILYYSNSTAYFKIEIMCCGDVQSHPCLLEMSNLKLDLPASM